MMMKKKNSKKSSKYLKSYQYSIIEYGKPPYYVANWFQLNSEISFSKLLSQIIT